MTGAPQYHEPPAPNVPTVPVSRARRQRAAALSIVVLLVGGFAVWAVVQWLAVDNLRNDLAARVRCLSAITTYSKGLQDAKSTGATRPPTDAIRSRCGGILSRDDKLWAAFDAATQAHPDSAPAAQELGAAVSRVREQSARISQQLGRHWDGLTWLIGGLVILCVATLALLHLAYRRGQKLEAVRHELHDLATHDALTRTLNRRVLMESLAKLMADKEQRLSLLMVDLDHFKQVNDTFGHRAGDRVLQAVTQTLRDNLKASTGLLGRYGGEEFIAVIAGLAYERARDLAEQLRQAVASSPVRFGDDEIHVSISIGVAGREHDTPTPEILIDRADKALYAAKSAGRNRVA